MREWYIREADQWRSLLTGAVIPVDPPDPSDGFGVQPFGTSSFGGLDA